MDVLNTLTMKCSWKWNTTCKSLESAAFHFVFRVVTGVLEATDQRSRDLLLFNLFW